MLLTPVSLDKPLKTSSDNGNTTNLLDLVSERADSTDTAIAGVVDGGEVSVLLDELNERERAIIDMRFGLSSRVPRTLEEVGTEFKVTRERIRQIEEKALKKMRYPSQPKLYR